MGIRIGNAIIQIKFEFRHPWPSLTGVIALCKNVVFLTLLCNFLDIDLKYGIWIGIDIIQIKFEFRHTWPNLQELLPFVQKNIFPDFSLQSFEILTWKFLYELVFLVCCGCDTSYIVSVHIQCQASKYTLSLCRGHSWRVRLAKQETLTPPGHLVSPLLCRGPRMSTVVLYYWCHSDSASVILYFTFGLNTDQGRVSSRVAYFTGVIALCKNLIFWTFSVSLWDFDLKCCIWLGFDLKQIKFYFRHAWSTFTGVIALCWNLVFRTFLCRPLLTLNFVYLFVSKLYRTSLTFVAFDILLFHLLPLAKI